MKRSLISALALAASLSLVACGTNDAATNDQAGVNNLPTAATGVDDQTAQGQVSSNPGGIGTASGGTNASGRTGVTNYSGMAGGVPPGSVTDTQTGAATSGTTVSGSTSTTANITMTETQDVTGTSINSGNRVESAIGSQHPSSAAGGAGNTRSGGTNTNLNNPTTTGSTVTVTQTPADTRTVTGTTTITETDTDVDVDVDDDDDDDTTTTTTTRRMVTKD